MPERPDIRAAVHLGPSETVAAWERRGALQPTVNWREMWQEEHARAFTVAKIAKLDLLNDVRESLDHVIREGGTFEDWKRDIRPALEREGWWGRVQDSALTGTDEEIYVGDRRLRTIYRTNIAVSQAAGQWQRIQARKEFAPYLRYVAILDRHTRDQHAAWHGLILPVDHPAWRWLFPPNDWGCRCTVQQLTERQMRSNGWEVSDLPPNFGPPQTTFRLRREGGQVTAEPAEGRDNIGSGWAYNPGAASIVGVARKARNSVDRAVSIGNDDVAARILEELVDSDDFAHILRNAILRNEMGHGFKGTRLMHAADPVAFPVAVLDRQDAAAAGLPRVLTMSGRVATKQFKTRSREAGPLVTTEGQIDLYRRLPRMLRGPRLILSTLNERAAGRRVVVMPYDAENWAVVVMGEWRNKDVPDLDEPNSVITAYVDRADRILEMVNSSEILAERWPGRRLI